MRTPAFTDCGYLSSQASANASSAVSAVITRHVRILTYSDPAPMPLLVASESVEVEAISALRNAFLSLNMPQDAVFLQVLALQGFIAPPSGAWKIVNDRAQISFAQGYGTLQ